MGYREELVQVAAVALAMLQDDESGTTSFDGDGKFVIRDLEEKVYKERVKQEQKWGPQHNSREMWLTILTEEVGEVARAILENDN